MGRGHLQSSLVGAVGRTYDATLECRTLCPGDPRGFDLCQAPIEAPFCHCPREVFLSKLESSSKRDIACKGWHIQSDVNETGGRHNNAKKILNLGRHNRMMMSSMKVTN